MPTLSGFTNFNPDHDVPSLKGKVILITGGTNGIGKTTLKALSGHEPEHIYFTGRNTNSANSCITELRKIYPSLSISFLHMDLASLTSVKSALVKFAHDHLDILICNAGILDVPPAVSTDGFEIQMATNHFGHAMLIRQLLPMLLRTAEKPGSDVRVVTIGSSGHTMHPKGGISWDKVRSTQSSLKESVTKYGQTKLANIAYSSELARRYPQIIWVSVQPGFVATDMVHNSSLLGRAYMYGLHWVKGISALTPEEGCLNQVWASAGAALTDLVNGGYYHPVGVLTQPDPLVEDKQFAAKLWSWTEEALDSV